MKDNETHYNTLQNVISNMQIVISNMQIVLYQTCKLNINLSSMVLILVAKKR